ncbi:PerC family transcriptional regulator [Klebsiella aerogenes]|uniref:PerC family transcriptional regulator n=1 Tax=Klebsiella aerogenes TaxID=548 RepID=UPI0034D1A7CA
MLLHDRIAEALERAGLWRRAATRWLLIFDGLETDHAREQVARRREACLLMASRGVERSAIPAVDRNFTFVTQPVFVYRFRTSTY